MVVSGAIEHMMHTSYHLLLYYLSYLTSTYGTLQYNNNNCNALCSTFLRVLFILLFLMYSSSLENNNNKLSVLFVFVESYIILTDTSGYG